MKYLIYKEQPDSSDVHVPTIMGNQRRTLSSRSLRKKRMRMEIAMSKGDYVGHPFRGNQWTRAASAGGAVGADRASAPKASGGAVPKGRKKYGPTKKTAAQQEAEIDSLSRGQQNKYDNAPAWMKHDEAMDWARGKWKGVDPDGDVPPPKANGEPMRPISISDLPKDAGPKRNDRGRFAETNGDWEAAGFRRPTDYERKYGIVGPDGERYRIPPNWRDVVVHRSPTGNSSGLLVSGFDAAGKPQPIYVKRSAATRASKKFSKVKDIASAMPAIDKKLEAGVKARSQEAIVASVMRETAIRVGSSTARLGDAEAFGATTLLASHVTVTAKGVRLRFPGKRGKGFDVTITKPPELVKALREIKAAKKGQRGPFFDTTYSKVSEYVGELHPGMTPHNFRHHKATTEAARLVKSMGKPRTKAELKKMRKEVGRIIGERVLNDTGSVALSSYISPVVFASWEKAVANAE